MLYRITKALPIILLLGVFACNNSTDKDYKGAVGASESCLLLVDEGEYSGSWKAAASHLKTVVTVEQWEDALNEYRLKLGKVLSRSLRSKEHTASLSGLGAGEYIIIQYETKFEHQNSAMETITVMLEKEGTWRVSGYDLGLK